MVLQSEHAWLQLASSDGSGGGALVVAVVLALVALGAPLFVVIGGLALACFTAFPVSPDTFESFSSFATHVNLIEGVIALGEKKELVAIPFFMIAGAVMSRGAIARRLVDVANACFGWLPGGLAISTIAACMFFAAISGSSPVTVITIGAIMLPALQAAGYNERLSLGLLTSAGSLGIIIPPSIPMIVYAIFSSSAGAQVDIEELFVAGIGPGLLIGLLLAGYCILNARGVRREPFDISKLATATLDGIWALFLPVFILGGIYAGLFNATEASAISVVLALVIELYIHRSIKVRELPDVFGETAVLMGSILIIVGVAFGFSEFMAIKEVPDAIVAWLVGLELTPVTFILLLNGLLLLVGCLMDIISAIILFVPLVAPVAGLCGLDPIHVGLIFIVNLEIGYLTPPLGMNLFVASTYFGKPFGEVIRSVFPFLGILLLSLMIVTYVPTVSMGLVNLRNDRPFYEPFPTQMMCEAPEAFTDNLLDDDALLNDALFGDDADADEDEGGAGEKSIQDLIADPEYRRWMAEDEDEVQDALPPLDEEEDEDAGDKSIQDLMKDPEYQRMLRDLEE